MQFSKLCYHNQYNKAKFDLDFALPFFHLSNSLLLLILLLFPSHLLQLFWCPIAGQVFFAIGNTKPSDTCNVSGVSWIYSSESSQLGIIETPHLRKVKHAARLWVSREKTGSMVLVEPMLQWATCLFAYCAVICIGLPSLKRNYYVTKQLLLMKCITERRLSEQMGFILGFSEQLK